MYTWDSSTNTGCVGMVGSAGADDVWPVGILCCLLCAVLASCSDEAAHVALLRSPLLRCNHLRSAYILQHLMILLAAPAFLYHHAHVKFWGRVMPVSCSAGVQVLAYLDELVCMRFCGMV
jgi:hypothetical protein